MPLLRLLFCFPVLSRRAPRDSKIPHEFQKACGECNSSRTPRAMHFCGPVFPHRRLRWTRNPRPLETGSWKWLCAQAAHWQLYPAGEVPSPRSGNVPRGTGVTDPAWKHPSLPVLVCARTGASAFYHPLCLSLFRAETSVDVFQLLVLNQSIPRLRTLFLVCRRFL